MSQGRDLVTVGRVSVDLYSTLAHASFLEPQNFNKSVGGSPVNVAVAAAKLGLRAAPITAVGNDPLGEYVRSSLNGCGVETGFIGIDQDGQTPLVLASLDPPEDPEILFYRGKEAPDTKILRSRDLDELVRTARIFWVSVGALAVGHTATSSLAWAKSRGGELDTALDLDYRPSLWPSKELARAKAQEFIEYSTIVVGNLTECEMALGERDPEAIIESLRSRNVKLMAIKMGGEGVIMASESDVVHIGPEKVDVVCGLGTGDAFGGAMIHGFLAGWPLRQIGEFANAAGAIVAGVLMCSEAMPTENEVVEFMKGKK